MNVPQPAALSEILLGRRERIARRWYDAIVRTSFVPFTEHDLFICLLTLTDQAIAAFLAEPFVPEQSRTIGTALARLHCLAPEALGGTQEVLATHLISDLPPETVVSLQPRLAGLLSGIAVGFISQSRKILLAEQEVIRQALLIQRLRVEESLRESEARFRTIFEGAAISIVLAGTDGRIIESNPAMETMLGYSKDELYGQPFLSFVCQEDKAAAWKQFESVAARIQDRYDLEVRFTRKDGQVVWGHVVGSFVRDAEGRPQFAIGMGEDITERKALEKQLAYQAYHDPLTGLPNRALFTDRLEQSLARATDRQGGVAVLFLDLDDFKLVNDSLGHKVGDGLLIAVAHRLQEFLSNGEMIARFGGDEFTILVEDVGSAGGITDLADRIAGLFKIPFELGAHEIRVSSSIGIAFDWTGGCDTDDLLRNADIAMYEAKRMGKARRVVFDRSINADSVQRLELELDLPRAIERQEFLLHYQPIISLETGRTEGIEALIRWNHPERGLLLPDTFIPLAEETGLIVPIGQWVLREACRQAKRWDDAWPDRTPLLLNVNISTRQLQQQSLVEELHAVFRETGLAPSRLVLELTENTVVDDSPSVQMLLSELKTLGVRLAIDDFGTGHSSLFNLMRRYPVDFVKIDRFFIERLGGNRSETLVLGGIIDLCHALGMKVIAEGIETIHQLTELRDLGADLGQGYWFTKPVAADEIASMAAHGLERERYETPAPERPVTSRQ